MWNPTWLTFSCLSMVLVACGPVKPSAIPTAPGGGGGVDPAYRPSEEAYVNPDCRNPFPVDAFAGLDGQRISLDEFIDGASGSYEIWQTDFYVREERTSPLAIHVRSWLQERAPERRAQATQDVRCQKEAPLLSEGGVAVPDQISRHDGTLADLWPTGFRFDTTQSGTAITLQSAFTANVPEPSGLKEWLAANARDAMIFRRSRTQYELRLRIDQAPREVTISATYLWRR